LPICENYPIFAGEASRAPGQWYKLNPAYPSPLEKISVPARLGKWAEPIIINARDATIAPGFPAARTAA
jgi:hypothetical protein